MSGKFRTFIDKVGDAAVRRFREETVEEREFRRLQRQAMREKLIAAYRAVFGGFRGHRRTDAERHYTLHPLDAPHPRTAGVQFVRVRVDDATKDVPVKRRPVGGVPAREYVYVRAGYGQGARVRREKRGHRHACAGNAP